MKKLKFILFLFGLMLFSVSCYERKKKTEWEEIAIGDYSCKFPPDFRLIERPAIDSYIGEIKGDSFCFYFGYGRYFGKLETTDRYLKQGDWHFDAENQYAYKFMVTVKVPLQIY